MLSIFWPKYCHTMHVSKLPILKPLASEWTICANPFSQITRVNPLKSVISSFSTTIYHDCNLHSGTSTVCPNILKTQRLSNFVTFKYSSFSVISPNGFNVNSFNLLSQVVFLHPFRSPLRREGGGRLDALLNLAK